MLSSIIENYTNFMMNATSGNEMLVSFISIGVIGSMVAFIRYVPNFIKEQVIRYTTTSFTINNTHFYSEKATIRMMSWLSGVISENSSRTLSFNYIESWRTDQEKKEHNFIGTGYGFHWFIFNGKLFWLKKEKLESSGSEIQKEEYTFRCFGRSHEPFKKLVENFAAEYEEDNLKIYTLVGQDWEEAGVSVPRSMNTIAMSDDKKKEIIDNIENFKNNKEWFTKAALPYKLTYILYGKPGSGKTSLIKAIASEFKMNLCVMNINTMSDSSLQKALVDMPKNSVLAIEDFDSSSSTKDRGISADVRLATTKTVKESNKNESNKNVEDSFINDTMSFLTLTGMLNALDGIIPLNDTLIFLTTNNIEAVDPALYRKGRVDYLMEMNELEPEDIEKFSSVMFPDFDFSLYAFVPSMGCYLNEALLFSRGNVERYIESLVSNNICKLK